MTDTILQDKVFRNSDDDDLSRTTDIWISRIRRHIRETNCAHCKNILMKMKHNIINRIGRAFGAPTPNQTETNSLRQTTDWIVNYPGWNN